MRELGLEQFYTKPKVAKKLLDIANEIHPLSSFDLIIEPSAGNGAFSDHLRAHKSLRAFDVAPKKPYIKQADFLKLDMATLCKRKTKIITLGNPPFGRQSSLAKDFIKIACDWSNVIAFILPKSFKKPSMQSVFPRKFHLIKSIDVGYNAFTTNGLDYDVPCVFQIWEKRDVDRQLTKSKYVSNIFHFVNSQDHADVCIRRIGVNAGRLIVNSKSPLSPMSHYFIKLDVPLTQFIEAYKLVKFRHNNTVGPRSISKPELIREIEVAFKK